MDSPLLPGTAPDAFGKFHTKRHLGSGAFGDVFLVRDAKQDYALKWLKSDAPARADVRFKNEIWALGQLDHPAIPKLVPEGEGQMLGRPYYVMTLAHGETLEKIIEKNKAQGAWFSELQVINLLVLIFEAATHLQSKGIAHRDIKPDNIIADLSLNRVWLLDIGCCTGTGRPHSADTFWNIGASRFSPPSKLLHPKETKTSHDTFAIGVVAYLLVTAQYPWSVGSDEDFGRLCDLMRLDPPEPIEKYNDTYSRELVDFIGRLLLVDDELRPTLEKALEEARELQQLFSERKLIRPVSKQQTITLPRVIRDPLYGDLRMTEFEWQIIETKAYQRLRWIKQLGFANLVYPGAEHSRFHHSLGTVRITDRILRAMQGVYGSRRVAQKAGLDASEVIIYCAPSAPGYSKARFRIARSLGKARPEELLELELLKRHTSLWSLFVFAPPGLANVNAQRLVDATQEIFSLQNELPIAATQQTLPLWNI